MTKLTDNQERVLAFIRGKGGAVTQAALGSTRDRSGQPLKSAPRVATRLAGLDLLTHDEQIGGARVWKLTDTGAEAIEELRPRSTNGGAATREYRVLEEVDLEQYLESLETVEGVTVVIEVGRWTSRNTDHAFRQAGQRLAEQDREGSFGLIAVAERHWKASTITLGSEIAVSVS